ncbi:MAG: carboxypeptidase-like regulatory domain-containing protein, partial [Bacteroidota bacterium]
MKKKGMQKLAHVLLTFSFLFVLGGNLFAQGGTIRGAVVDEFGEPVIGANVIIQELQTGAATNSEGIFSIPKLPAGEHVLRVTYIGMDTTTQTVGLGKNKIVSISLEMRQSSTKLKTVQIMDQKIGKIRKRDFDVGKTRITQRQIKLMPSLGAPDLAQYLQVLPGVVFTGDQGGQLYVRGGTPIMNMVLLDGMIVYNPFHSIGLFSIFDTDYIRSVDVFSAAFPAQYGGRVSSIMDVRSKMPDFNGIRGKVNINPISTGVLIEGPFARNKEKDKPGGNGFLLSMRNAYLDQTSPTFYDYATNDFGGDSVRGLPYTFTDIYGKLSFSDGLSTV